MLVEREVEMFELASKGAITSKVKHAIKHTIKLKT